MSIFAIDRFDENEWFLIIGVLLTYLIAFALPKKLPSPIALLLFVWAFTVSKFYDFTFGGGLFDYYDINDSSSGSQKRADSHASGNSPFCLRCYVSFLEHNPGK